MPGLQPVHFLNHLQEHDLSCGIMYKKGVLNGVDAVSLTIGNRNINIYGREKVVVRVLIHVDGVFFRVP